MRTFRYLHIFFWLFVLIIAKECPAQENSKLAAGQHYQAVTGGNIWYHVMGKHKNPPLIMLHGGPGGTSYSLYRFHELKNEFTVIIFDQLGTGRSGDLKDTSLMTMTYQVEQMHEFLDSLHINEFYLYGHSWGTMLGLDYYLAYPEGIKALIFNSPLVSTDLWMKDAKILISTLPRQTRKAIRRNERKKTYDTPEYNLANMEYYRRYISRSGKPFQAEYDLERVPGNNLMYNYMWGPSEFNSTGTLRNYDRLDALSTITVPTLFITGEFDEARPETVEYYHSLLPGSEFEIIVNAAHGTMHDNPEANIRVIRVFLDGLEEKEK